MSGDSARDDQPTEFALEESAEELYEMAPCGYLTATIDGRIVKANRTLAEWLGYEPAELVGHKRFVDLLTVGGRIFYETHFNLLLRVQSAVDEIALDIICKNGRVLPVLINARQKRDAAGEPVLNRFTIFNATQRRMYERDLLAAREQLAKSAAELRRSNEDLSQFAHIASHDLRSPLITITQFAQLLQRDYSSRLGDGKEILDYLTSAAKRMNILVEDLLSYSKVSTDSPQSLTPVDANIQLRTAVENLQSVIRESGAAITHNVLPVVFIESTNLVQIFLNLIGNAIHYCGPSPPRIHIAAADHPDEWLFSCKDNGIGIELEFQSRIFEPFKRLHGADRPGSGIGLAVCKRIVERYKGRIWVESEVNRGSTFFFTLPKNL